MKQRIVPALAISYFLAMLVAMTYPGYVPFNRIRPFVLGMPFSLFWQLIWIAGAVAVLGLLFLWDKRDAGHDGERVGDSARAGGE